MRLRRLAFAFFLAACTTDAPIAVDDDASTMDVDSGREDSSTEVDSGPEDTGPSDAGTGEDADNPPDSGDVDSSSSCAPTEVGMLCVRPDTTSSVPAPGNTAIQMMIFPRGCFSSACTGQEVATCTASQEGNAIAVSGEFCLSTQGDCTLPDCSGGGFVRSDPMELPDGEYTATLGDLEVTFTVPDTIDGGGTCDGSMF